MNTTALGILKLVIGGIGILGGAAYIFVTKDATTGLSIIGTAGAFAGLASGAGLIKAQDAPKK